MANSRAFFRSEIWAVLIRCRGQTLKWMDLLMVDVNVSGFFCSLFVPIVLEITDPYPPCPRKHFGFVTILR
ncbi:hypothetical protein Bca52824_066003 [Brassica carinata]|uniref:Uncharacterized protein n=1 Tax=Brassica carinata TaxID=52824 RepID=A0A8X7QKC9_BRACI|nr:hypothetical protein Bca52824_066003 [Brassica carinata]